MSGISDWDTAKRVCWALWAAWGVGSAGPLTGQAGTNQLKGDTGSVVGRQRPFVLQTLLPLPLVYRGSFSLYLVASQPRSFQALQCSDMFVFLLANFIKVWGHY